jgi:hypothetical protein
LERKIYRRIIQLFCRKVKEKLLNNDGHNNYTYREIIDAIKHIGLDLCNDLRLTNQLKDVRYIKQELGSFCEQYSFPHYKESYKFTKNSTKFKHKQLVYGQISHYKNNCKIKDKIKELNINDKLKSQLLNILSESDIKSE